ncbi:MAG: hypothetical protein IIY76_10020 [Erysipelotrichaceae bacterium]|nr:hypothetical protein [Erysipelotrichaceae bacterium]
MKYMKLYTLVIEVILLFLALFGALRIIAGIIALTVPIMDAVLSWMGDHALVGGLTVAIWFVVVWFGEECERAIRRERKERNGKC